jgi:hypothetical protein
MRLFEVDQGSVRDVLSIFKGLADKQGRSSSLPFPVVLNIIRPFSLGISTPDGLIALKNAIDPQGDVFDVSDDGKGTVILNTVAKSDADDQTQTVKKSSPSIDKMAKSNSKNLKPDL